MKTKYLKLNKPCSEEWSKLTATEKGAFCDLCSKNVIDFTQLSQTEISLTIKNSKEPICARVTHRQLNTPLFDFETQKNYKLPYSNIAAGLLIATALTSGQSLHAKNSSKEIEVVETVFSTAETETETITSTIKNNKSNTFSTFKGSVTTENGDPIENVKITFITIEKILTTYTLANGSFSLDIPIELLDNDNVIRVSYHEIIKKENKEAYNWFEQEDFILSSQEINADYKIEAESSYLEEMGEISLYTNPENPLVISEGKEIDYQSFIEAQQGKKSSCSLENKEYYYFESRAAIAIYGTRAENGLYILTTKEE